MLKFYDENDSITTETCATALFGEPGIGKTSLANTSKDCFMIDFDRGIQRAIYKQRYARVDKWEDVIELQKSPEFMKIQAELKTLIVDTTGTMLDNYIANYVKDVDPKNQRRGGELSLQGYGAMKSVFKQFKDWARSLNCNLIFVCHATSVQENDNVKFQPKMTGGSYDILREEADLIGYMYSSMNKRVVDFRPVDSHVGKDCAGIGIVEIPDASTPEYPLFFQSIIERTLAKMNEISEKQRETLAKIADYRDKIKKLNVKGCKDSRIIGPSLETLTERLKK